MGKYKVVVIQQSLRNNKVAKFGAIVEDSQLPSPAKELIEKGFIVSYETETEVEVKKETVNIETKIENIEVVSETVKKEVKPKK